MPTGPNGLAREALRNAIADCTAFRAWHGNAWTQSQARDRIHYGGLPKPADNKAAHSLSELNQYRPYVVLWTEEEGGIVLSAVAAGTAGGGSLLVPSGLLVARFERLVDAADEADTGLAENEMIDEMDSIIASYDPANPGLNELAGVAGYLDFHRLEGHGPFRAEEDLRPTFGDFVRYYMVFHWGIAG